MIGWSSTASRDYEEQIEHGYVDEDLDRMEGAIRRRKWMIKYPSCPVCNEPLAEEHCHKAASANGTGYNIAIRNY